MVAQFKLFKSLVSDITVWGSTLYEEERKNKKKKKEKFPPQ